MFKTQKNIRVRYGETDQMGYVYYGNYALYFEEGRTDAIRLLGLTYSEMEKDGILLPVTDFNVKFKHPAFYDEVLTVFTSIPELPSGVRIHFEYTILNQEKKLICTGNTTLAFIDKQTRKPVKAPQKLILSLKAYF